jgi:hypothetical protein
MAMSGRPAWRKALDFLLNLLTAVFGAAFFTITIYSFYPRARTDYGMVGQELVLSAGIAAAMGCIAARFQQTTARWIWVVPAGAFLCALILLPNESVPSYTHPMKSDLWASGCRQVHGMPCVLFYAFTVPAVRAICYSIAATIALRFRSAAVRDQPAES